eukprot:752189-Rhodomonas_salina.3
MAGARTWGGEGAEGVVAEVCAGTAGSAAVSALDVLGCARIAYVYSVAAILPRMQRLGQRSSMHCHRACTLTCHGKVGIAHGTA